MLSAPSPLCKISVVVIINYTYSEMSIFSLFYDTVVIFDRSKIIEIMNLKQNFLLLFFENRYLSCYLSF